MEIDNDNIIPNDNLFTLNKKRKRTLSEIDNEQKENIKIKKENVKNYLEFELKKPNDIYNKYSDIDNFLIGRKVHTTTENNFNYMCKEIKSDTSIQINDS